MAEGNILSTWESAGVTISTYKILYMDLYIYSYREYICMGANILLFMLYLSMYLYTEYSVYMYMDICGYGVLINGCIYELIFN